MVKFITLNEKMETVEEIEIPQKQLTSECWLIQFKGLLACEGCQYLDTNDCGGKNIRKTLLK